jgi:hypothetical protein
MARDIRFEDRPEPKIQKPTDAIIRMSATCVCVEFSSLVTRGVTRHEQEDTHGAPNKQQEHQELCRVVDRETADGRNMKRTKIALAIKARMRPERRP